MVESPVTISRRRRSPAAGRRWLRLKMPSRREAVAPTVKRVLQELTAARLEVEQVSNLTVALSEALSNAVVHGNAACRERPVLVVACADVVDGVIIDVRDFGPGFDVAAVTDCCQEERVLATSGRGMFLMRHLVDAVEYNARGNRVRLRMRPRGPSASGGS
jgi:serine/threonine-protein kinase RsbW